MTEETQISPGSEALPTKGSTNTLLRIFRYGVVRLLSIAVTVVIAVFLTIVVANLGGKLDTAKRAYIDEAIGMRIQGGWLSDVIDPVMREAAINQAREAMIESAGLNTPFLVRTFRWLWDGLTLNWGDTYIRVSIGGIPSRQTSAVILDYLPRTLLVFGGANVLLFFVSIALALGLSRRYGSWQDKLVTALAPLAAAPSWAYGLLIAAVMIHIFHTSFSKFDEWPSGFNLAYLPYYAKRLLPAMSAIFISKLFQSIYAWRTLFLVNSSEEYVDIAKAKGLPGRMLEWRYILRPVLPNVITSFALILVSLWQEVIVLETIFAVEGVGYLFYQAIRANNILMTVALVTMFAYMIAVTVFLLDMIYALVDPRVKIGGGGTVRSFSRRRGLKEWLRLRRRDRDLPPPVTLSWREHEIAPAETAPVPLAPAAPRLLLLRDTAAATGGMAGRSMQQYVLELGHRLAEAGVLLQASDAFWLTRDELKAASDALKTGRAIRPLSLVVRERRTALQISAAQASVPPPAKMPRPSAAPHFHYHRPSLLARFGESVKLLAHYPSAVAGVSIILFLIAVSIYTVIALPYRQAVKDWRGDDMPWMRNPQYAGPAWLNWFRSDDLPETVIMDSRSESVSKTREVLSEVTTSITFSLPFDYTSTHYPSEMIIFFTSTSPEKNPLIALTWVMPDGRQIEVGSFSITSAYNYYVFQDERLLRKLRTPLVEQGMFGDPATELASALPGRYELQVTAYVFEPDADVNAEMVVYGKVHGMAGTDGRRRDLMLGLLWGTPVALAFGLLAAGGTTLSTIIIAAVGTWFGGWVDDLIQRLTEINMILPFFPVSLMIYILYSKSFWVILGVTVLLSVFGSAIKNYRSLFLQIKELPFFEAARAYGASDTRIIFRYMIPRIGTILVPHMVILVPTYVYLEAALSILGLYDPATPPTWGQLVLQGLSDGVYQGAFYMVYEPAVLLMLTGYAFLLLGMSLERVFEPRLRER